MIKRCALCADTGWVCEVHPDKPWSGAADEQACHCGAHGIPCELCNPDDMPNMLRMIRSKRDNKDRKHLH